MKRRPNHSFSGAVAVGSIIAASATVLWLTLSERAHPHDAPMGWSYPRNCCSGYDCREVPDADVREGPDGYVIRQSGEVVPYRDARVKDSPDGRFHWCSVGGTDLGRTICLFVPPRGF